MSDDRPLFILAGNGPYDNRGCEAIVRGTTKILRAHFKDPRFVCLSHFQNEEQFQKQKAQEYDEDIEHLHSNRLSKNKIVKNFWALSNIVWVSLSLSPALLAREGQAPLPGRPGAEGPMVR